ncbi:adenylate/guanylate cyclase domain-containing protein [Chitinophaga alhagiae]|uniref:adenylate/guanylate cyclase domain-containing protein n=1 Tax=Chitinophaga alhagiae TaxID=2203219 RepID=UPI000E5B757E|nr:adenylate/guanylate cyclase domain-containing protein [Chitinophaga alhagiae]
MNGTTQFKFRQLGVVVITWLVIGLLIAIYDHLVLHTHNAAGPSAQYTLAASIALNMGIGLFGALLGGGSLIFFVNVKYQDKPYGQTILVVTISFILIILTINLILRAFSLPDSIRMAKNGLVWAVVVATTQLLLQINSKFGPGTFWNIISGKYNTPREERRIFMFLDINSSTSIAERLGDKKYHELLKDFFMDITNPVLDCKGEIYQYVGDEVVIAWQYENGIENSQCVQCFFDIKRYLQKKEEKYLQQYGVLPSFKAGIHCGHVIAGEIGVIKRDITYSGDVLNTTSRIQSLCKEFNEEVIMSADLAANLRLTSQYSTAALGVIRLRGKEKEMRLIALRPSVNS